MLLRLINKCRKSFTKGCEPLSVIYEVGKTARKLLLLVRCHLIKAESFKIVVRKVEDFSAGRFIYAAALHTYKTVIDDIKKSYTVFAAKLVECENDILCAHLLTVKSYGNTLHKIESYVSRNGGSLEGRNSHFKKTFFIVKRLVSCIL